MSFHFIAWNETFFWVHFFVYFSFIDRGHQNLILDDCAKLQELLFLNAMNENIQV
jgi:hypothetical protein